jgi:hypothetical protein
MMSMLKGLGLTALGLGLLAAGSGCTTDAFCFSNCAGETGGQATTVSSSSGVGGFTSSSGAGGDCFPNCGTGGADGGSCVQTNGGVEICDGIDNDCNGTTDDLPGLDLTDPHTCGTCSNDCFQILLNRDAASIKCMAPAQPGMPGTCTGTCAQDYVDLDMDGKSCEYYCVKSGLLENFCNNIDDDCDGLKDEDVDFCTSTTDCGTCNHSCQVIHGQPACVHQGGGQCTSANTDCTIAKCDCNGPGDCWWDLDKSYATGCEYQCDLTDGGGGMGIEVCGDGIDNDCDGLIDEADDLSGDPKIGVVCHGSPVGECGAGAHAGTMGCVAHQYACVGANVIKPGEVPETCNLKDDDCDGTVDNNLTDTGMACGVSNIFPCSKGSMQCVAGALTCIGAINPGVETCNGVDDDCDGQIDATNGQAPPDAVGACNVPPPPPVGATSPCKAGNKACVGGTVTCQGSVGPTGNTDGCNIDSNCDGVLTNQPDTKNDPKNCGMCGNDCNVGAVHANWGCANSACVFLGCQPGYYDLNNDKKCEYACNFVSAKESCNGQDDNCDGQIDEPANLQIPTATQVCGVSPSAATPECTNLVGIACTAGAWKCTFPANVCSPSCGAATEICDNLDNNCNGLINETTPNYGQPCASDDAAPGTQGVCRTTGTFICNGNNATKCSATPNLALAGPELCDGLDNDCDGSIDETNKSKGSNAMYFMKPSVVKTAANVWMYAYEASRPSATNITPGNGNGYVTSAPAGTTLDKTPACSVQGKIPWFNVTPNEATQTCTAMGGHVCTTTEWQTSCEATNVCKWGFNPRNNACLTAFTGTKYCNIGPSYDFDAATAGDQDGLLVTGSPALGNCWSDWSNLNANPATANKLFDMTGNLREITVGTGNPVPYVIMGGAFNSQTDSGATCQFKFYQTTDPTLQFYDTGFRCCFSADPTL